jgi:hypothetical protein
VNEPELAARVADLGLLAATRYLPENVGAQWLTTYQALARSNPTKTC